MATITAQSIVAAGTTVVYSAVNASDQFLPDDRLILHVKNASGSSINVTVVDAGITPAGNAATSAVVAVGAGAEKEIYVSRLLNNPATGFITVNYSATATVTAALKKV